MINYDIANAILKETLERGSGEVNSSWPVIHFERVESKVSRGWRCGWDVALA